MKRNKFLELIGYKFIANHNSKEIHRVTGITNQCRLLPMTNAEYCSAKTAKRLIKDSGYNGCRYCYKEADNG